jgi:hypothetical protein
VGADVNETLIGHAIDRRPQGWFPPFAAFYHIAAMGNWKDVVREQMATFDVAGLGPICHVNGDESDVEYVKSLGLKVASDSRDLHEYETPTLELVHRWCCDNPTGAVAYFHTKGVSAPADESKAAWRRLMMRHVIWEWRRNLRRLEIADLVGVNWIDSADHPHFSGNFWMARTDWVASRLPAPREHRDRGGPRIMGNPWERWHAEAWVGANQWHIVDSLACRNENFLNPNCRFFDEYR